MDQGGSRLSRRAFLARGSLTAAGLWVAGTASARSYASAPAHARLPALARRGGGVPDPSGTTLEATIIRPGGAGYLRLTDGPGWPTVVRDELATPEAGRENIRRPIAAIVHLTDIHLIDAQSTGRVEFLDPEGEPFTAAFRPQETLTTQVASSMVERINSLPGGPVTGRPFDCAVSTGDNIDNQQLNEARWFLGLLDGGEVRANSGLADRYEGVQDDVLVDAAYWHPDEGIDDIWKSERAYPTIPGLLDASREPFDAPGLSMPWYSTYGNHDGLVQGVIPTTEAIERVLVDRWKITGLPPGSGSVAFIGGVALAPPDELMANLSSGRYPAREVEPDEDRRTVSPTEWVQLHLDSPARPGPAGHGYTDDHLELPALYYDFEVAPGVLGLSLDTGGYYSGSIGEDQLSWMEETLIGAHSRYYGPDGGELTTDNDDQVVIVFSHFNNRSMDQVIADPDRPDERRALGPEVVALLHRFPNVIAWVNGHHHVNEVQPLTDPAGHGAFWDINTASHVDYPQHARLIEVTDNDDGTISIFCTMIEHSAPATVDYDDFSVPGLASMSRELSANDPQSDLAVRLGTERDLNVELMLPAPFDLKAAGIGDSTTSTTGPDRAQSAAPSDADDDPSTLPLVLSGAAVLATAGVAGAVALRRRTGAEPDAEDAEQS